MDDNTIIEMYADRNQSAISETAAKYGSYCKVIAMNILGNREDAEECTNDTYMSAWNAIPPQKPLNLKAFLGKIARNLSLSKYRKNTAKKRSSGECELILDELADYLPSIKDNVENLVDSKLTAEIISEFLRDLSYEQRAVFMRRYWYMDSVADVAYHFNISESKAKSMLMRVRNRLKIHLEDKGITI